MQKKWKNWFGVVLSLLVMLSPFLGLPRGMKDVSYVLFGIILIIIFFRLAYDKTSGGK